MLASQSTQQNSIRQAGVSEIVIPAWEQDGFELVLPMLAHLSHQAQGRWLTWVGTSGLSQPQVSDYAFKQDNVRLIHSRNDEETLRIMWNALQSGTSAFVAGSFINSSSVQSQEHRALESASHYGNARALVLKLAHTST